MVLLLNLASIPDQIVRDINLRPGFSRKFKEQMKEYQENFSKMTGQPWSFINQDLITQYIIFKRRKQVLEFKRYEIPYTSRSVTEKEPFQAKLWGMQELVTVQTKEEKSGREQ